MMDFNPKACSISSTSTHPLELSSDNLTNIPPDGSEVSGITHNETEGGMGLFRRRENTPQPNTQKAESEAPKYKANNATEVTQFENDSLPYSFDDDSDQGEAEEDMGSDGEVTKPTSKGNTMKKESTAPSVDWGRSNKKLRTDLPPISDPKEMLRDLTERAIKDHGFKCALEFLKGLGIELRVATMFSGTEAPLIALQLINEALGDDAFEFKHLFSVEIEPYIQVS